jgi:hypothetical protein
MGEHTRQGMPQRRTIGTIELVDVTGTAHRVSIDAAADGPRRGTYVTLCGGDVVAAALAAREARHCRLCAPLPAQRTRGSRR